MASTQQPYFDEQRGKWMIDDYGRPREATPEEVEAYLDSLLGEDNAKS